MAQVVKEYVCNAGSLGWENPLEEGNRLQYSCLENPPRQRSLVGYGLLLLSHFSRVQLCVTPWTAAHQAPLSLGFSRKEH